MSIPSLPVEDLPSKKVGEVEFFDPVNQDNNVAEKYTKEDKDKIVEYAWDALDSINSAHYATTQEIAVEQWQKVVGPTFKVNL